MSPSRARRNEAASSLTDPPTYTATMPTTPHLYYYHNVYVLMKSAVCEDLAIEWFVEVC